MPPCWFFDGFGRVCFLVKFTRSTIAVPLVGSTRSTRPCLPRSLPERTTTVSFFLTCGFARAVVSFCRDGLPYMMTSLDDFGSERDDLHELPLAQLARD